MKCLDTVGRILELVGTTLDIVEPRAGAAGDPSSAETHHRLARLEQSAARVRAILELPANPRIAIDRHVTQLDLDQAAESGKLVPALAECLAGIERIRGLGVEEGAVWRGILETALERAFERERSGALRRAAKNTTQVYGRNADRPIAILLCVVKGDCQPDHCVVAEGEKATVGHGRDHHLAFAVPADIERQCEIRLNEGIAWLSAAKDRPVTIGGDPVSETNLAHRDIVCVGEDAWIQVLIPAEEGVRRMPTDRLEIIPPLGESSRELEAVLACAGGCGRALDADDERELAAVTVDARRICVDCIVAQADAFETVDDYVVVRRIKSGGMGEVYAAVERSTRQIVAYKIIRTLAASDPGALVRFAREARLLSRLDHPNIVRILGSGSAGNSPYIVMEYVRGRSLDRMLSSRARLPPEDAIRIARRVARALDYAHSRDIVHRDVKPENIMVDSRGKVRLIDLGLAKMISNAGDSFVTSPGATVGTLNYMSPEQLQDARSVDHRADIYSLAVTLYESLAGVHPFAPAGGLPSVPAILEGPPSPTWGAP